MDKTEAAALLAFHLADYRRRSYAELRTLVGAAPAPIELVAASGARYQIEVQVFWDDAPGGALRVLGGIHDGGWRAFAPLCDDFLVSPDGRFVGASDSA